MCENDENLFTWQRPFKELNPISQHKSTCISVGLPAGEKTAKIGRVLSEQIGPEVVQTGKSCGNQGHPRSLKIVPFDKDKISYIFFAGTIYAYLASFWNYGVKTKLHKTTRSSAIAEGPAARCVVSVEILPIATQQCRNYLYDKT